ncbi:hypothetical protein OsI_31530 [Oryza sativa Indica Group]|uniref:Uncharacterized protein n=1 Tax=Oryza sativa subsp. indica TaxID=39946 RepID=A2Z1P6_ORYSI|nr:hypothetical protein OsI_31530 [Oryza sativa Indica Group]
MEMELPSWASVLVIVLAAVVFLLATILRHGRRAYRLPPGPNPWPIIGNLNLIGALPHRSIHELSKRYGPLMQLRFGSFPVVVGSSAEMARFFLKSHDIVFTDRPRTAAGKHTTYNYTDILWSPYGAYWRQARKMCVTELFSARRLESFEHIRGEEVRALLRDLHGAAAPVLLRDYLSTATLGVISRMVLGKKYVGVEGASAGNGGGGEGTSPAATPEEFKMMMDELFLLSGVLNIGDFIPWLDWLDLQGYIRRMKRVGKKLDRFMEHVLDEHDKVRRQQGDRFAARDLVDVLLQLADDPNLEVQLRRDNVKALTQVIDPFSSSYCSSFTQVIVLSMAHGDTSAITVEWAISELLRKPEILAKATEELDRVVGRGRLVTETDMPSLPYVEAIVKETMRVHPVAPPAGAARSPRGRLRRRLRHPRRNAGARQRVDHRPRPGAVGLAGGVHAGEVHRQQDRREGAGLPAAAVRVRPPDVPRPQPRAEGDTAEPRQPAARLRVEAPRRRVGRRAEHGGGLRPVHAEEGSARGRR